MADKPSILPALSPGQQPVDPLRGARDTMSGVLGVLVPNGGLIAQAGAAIGTGQIAQGAASINSAISGPMARVAVGILGIVMIGIGVVMISAIRVPDVSVSERGVSV